MPASADAARHHVVHVIGTLRTGGAERQLVNYLLAAERQAFRHTVVCLEARGDLAPAIEAAGVPVVLMKMRMRHLPGCILRFARWLREADAVIVHTHMHDAALWGRLAVGSPGFPSW